MKNGRWLAVSLFIGIAAAFAFYRFHQGYWVQPSRSFRIIHVCNWLWRSRESFAIDLRQTEPDLPDAQVDERYATFLDDVEELQNEQVFNLRQLVRTHALRSVFYEGVTDDNRELYEAANRKMEVTEKLQKKMSDAGNSVEAMRIRQNLNRLFVEMREDRLQLGAAGALLRDGTIAAVVPLVSTESLEAANPVTPDGQIQLDPAANKSREAEMVRRLIAGGPVAIVILGGNQNLTDALKATGPPFTYERIEMPTYTKLSASTIHSISRGN